MKAGSSLREVIQARTGGIVKNSSDKLPQALAHFM